MTRDTPALAAPPLPPDPAPGDAPPPWPRRWIGTMLLPDAVVLTALIGGAAVVSGSGRVAAGAAAALTAAAYARRLVRVAHLSADQRAEPVTPGRAVALDATRYLPSLLARGLGGTVVALVAGAAPAVAVPAGAAFSFAAGWVQLTRQQAIVETFRD